MWLRISHLASVCSAQRHLPAIEEWEDIHEEMKPSRTVITSVKMDKGLKR